MKRFLILLTTLFCNVVFADTINLHWLNEDGSTYENSTCVIDSDLILPSTPPTKYGYTFTGWKIGNYRPIEYLEFNDDGQKIYAPSSFSSTYLHVKMGVLLTKLSDMDIAGGNASAFGNNGKFFIYTGGSGFTYYTNTTQTGIKYDIEYIITSQQIELIVDNNSLNRNANTNISGNGAFSIGGNSNKKFYGKIYYYKLFDENGILFADAVPVLDANGTPCMFDRVEGKFYYNQGTGQFIAGPVL